ncbi:hypothetical protein GCM10009849_09390 [Sinomonas flava]|uniref:Uncharacterized protein n=1 Tax=Sinomonas flava TaxID=496857 RepID=A0ABN3BNA4_9MICC
MIQVTENVRRRHAAVKAVPPSAEVTPCGPEVTPCGPDITPCGADITPCGPDVTPCEPDVTPCGPDVTPCEPDVTLALRVHRGNRDALRHHGRKKARRLARGAGPSTQRGQLPAAPWR